MQFSDMMYTIKVAVDGNSVMLLKRKDTKADTKKSTNAKKPVANEKKAVKTKK
jgi:hypothetical protein